MLSLRRSAERGHRSHGWLNTFHTFSFADYYDPDFMGFRSLRVINEDTIAPANGFGLHAHDNMEILTWIIDGELTHTDSLGNEKLLQTNEAQVMSAGTGITHSEKNASNGQAVHLLQIWIEPNQYHQPPRYDQKLFPREERTGHWQVIASSDGTLGALVIGQESQVFLRYLQIGEAVTKALDPNHGYWLQNISAELEINGQKIKPGDAMSFTNESTLQIQNTTKAGEVMLFELR